MNIREYHDINSISALVDAAPTVVEIFVNT